MADRKTDRIRRQCGAISRGEAAETDVVRRVRCADHRAKLHHREDTVGRPRTSTPADIADWKTDRASTTVRSRGGAAEADVVRIADPTRLKKEFTRRYLKSGGVEQNTSESRKQNRRRGVW